MTLNIIEVLQEIRRRIDTQPLAADEQRALLQILDACGRTVERPLPGRDMQEIRGQAHVKRTLEVSAAGGHHILLIGPHGAGKTLLARTLPSLLPTAAVPYPFRAPGPDTDITTFVGVPPCPGELTLAHGGVLFLDDLNTFARPLLSALQRAVETRVVVFPQGAESFLFPANFLLIAATMPCPCGFFNDPIRECSCTAEMILEYQQRGKEIIDTCFAIQIEVPRVREDLLSKRQEESSASIRQRVEGAWARQRRRYAESATLWVNADLETVDEVQRYCTMDASAERLLRAALQQLHPSPKSFLTLHKVARTIADLADADVIAANHVAEAIQYRPRI